MIYPSVGRPALVRCRMQDLVILLLQIARSLLARTSVAIVHPSPQRFAVASIGAQ